MDPVRVVLVDMPLLLREVISRIVASEPRLDLVAEIGELARLGPVIDACHPGFVIGGDELLGDAEATAVLRRCPSARVLTVTSDGARSFLFELTPTRRAMGEISSKGLIEVILG